MVDIAGVFNFEKESGDNYANPLYGLYSGAVCRSVLKEKKVKYGILFYAQEECSSGAYFAGAVDIFIFGVVFPNNKYNDSNPPKQKRLQPCELYEVFKKYGTAMVEYIKGNFSIVIYDNSKKELFLTSSRLNTLPLFYCLRNNDFIFSSSIKSVMRLSGMSVQLDERAMVEQALFYNPLGKRTHINNIFQLKPAEILKFDELGIKTEKYWDIKNLFTCERLLAESQAMEKCIYLMKNNMNLYTSDTDKFLLSLTGGFDSRTNLALLDRNQEDFLCYSYGMPGSSQIKIPLLISKILNLNYKTIFLDNDFEGKYEEYAIKALEYSDGTAPISHANFPYVYEQLSSFSKINITGLFGSEIIKPLYKANTKLNQETINLFLCSNFDREFSKIIMKLKEKSFLQPKIIDRYTGELREDFLNENINSLRGFNKQVMLHIFFIEEAIRKYFMREIRIERRYVESRAPYFDDDFLQLVFRTPFAGLYKGAGKRNIFSRRKSQTFYAKVINLTNPALGDIIIDKGYSPKDLLQPAALRLVKVLPLYLKQRAINKMKGNDTFKSQIWAKNIIEKYIYKIGNADDIFTDKLINDFKQGLHLKNDFRFFSMFSLRLWLYSLDKGLL